MESRALMLDLLRSRKPTYSLPQPFYNDPEFFQLDMQHIFGTQWLFAGLSCEISKPGHYFTFNVGQNPLMVVRGQDKQIRAFYNTCRHRGSKICLKEKGSAAKLVCPYHQWTFDLDGRLLFAGSMDKGFDPAQYPLKQAHCESVGGYIFVSLADGPAPDFEAFRQAVEPYLRPHDLDNAKVAFESHMIEQANWKLVLENNRECYHCAGSHPELLRTLAEFDDPADPRINPKFVEKMNRKSQEWDALGLAHRAINDPAKRYRVVRLPFQHGESMTMDGKPACKKLLGTLTDSDLGSVRLLNLPNSWNHLQGDHCIAFRVLPLSPQETLVTTKWLVHKDAVEGVDYDVERLSKVWLATNEQDRTLAEQNQLGINSKAYEPGPYSQTIEFGVQSFIDWYTGEMQRQLEGNAGRQQAAA